MTNALSCYMQGADGNLLSCVLGDLVAATGGEALFGVLVAGSLMLAMWIAGNGDLSTPSVLLIILGSLMGPLLPGQYVQMAQAIIAIGIVGGVIAGAKRYILSGAAR